MRFVQRLATAAVSGGAVILAACSSAPASLTVGCAAPVAAGEGGPALVGLNYGPAMTPIPLNAVLYTQEAITREVAVQGLYSARTAGGTVEVSARFVNCTDRPAVVRARTTFMAKNTAPLEAASAWQPVALPPRATALYIERSLARDGVEHFLVEVAP